jgi:hypothetical protein
VRRSLLVDNNPQYYQEAVNRLLDEGAAVLSGSSNGSGLG